MSRGEGRPKVARSREVSEVELIIEGTDCSRAGLGPKPKRGQKVFKVYFNRPAMFRGDPLVWTVKYDNRAHAVKDIDCRVPVCTRFRKDGPQPRAGLYGYANKIAIFDDIAVIV